MNLASWLQSTCEAVRDCLTDEAAEVWLDIMREWELTDNQWHELQRAIVRQHGRGPLRFAEIEDEARRILSDANCYGKSDNVVEMRRNRDGPGAA